MGKIFKALEKSRKKNSPREVPASPARQGTPEPPRSRTIPPASQETSPPQTSKSHISRATHAPSSPSTATQAHGRRENFPPPQKNSLRSAATPVPGPSRASEPARGQGQAQRANSTPVPGPSHAAKPHETVVAYSRPHSPEAEQFRMLKTTILFPDKALPPRTIMITSSAPGEGKSFVAANLAVSMANGIDEHVLLMDCDLRKPTLHRLFGFSDKLSGLTEYLTHGVPLVDILRKTRVPKLTLLPCGTPPPNPSELISSEQMKKLILEVKSRYPDRYIIIDAPPPDVTAEANALARQVDAIIIVVKTGYSKKTALKDIVETYGREKILGVVKNYAEKTKLYDYGS